MKRRNFLKTIATFALAPALPDIDLIPEAPEEVTEHWHSLLDEYIELTLENFRNAQWIHLKRSLDVYKAIMEGDHEFVRGNRSR